jgi:hypothetical protein
MPSNRVPCVIFRCATRESPSTIIGHAHVTVLNTCLRIAQFFFSRRWKFRLWYSGLRRSQRIGRICCLHPRGVTLVTTYRTTRCCEREVHNLNVDISAHKRTETGHDGRVESIYQYTEGCGWVTDICFVFRVPMSDNCFVFRVTMSDWNLFRIQGSDEWLTSVSYSGFRWVAGCHLFRIQGSEEWLTCFLFRVPMNDW